MFYADEIEVKESLSDADKDARPLTKSPDMYVKNRGRHFLFLFHLMVVLKMVVIFHVMYEGQKVDLYKKFAKEFTEEREASSSIVRNYPS